MSKFSLHVIEDISRNLQDLNTSNFHKGDKEYPQHLMENIQEFIPIYGRFLKDANLNVHSTMSLNHRYHVINGNQLYDTKGKQIIEQQFFVKYSPLLDPLRYLIGKYDSYGEQTRVLPSMDKKHVISKLDDMNNCAYTDGFFYYLSSRVQEQYYFPHGIDYYGSYLAIQKYYKINVEEDMEYLSGSQFFNENLNRRFVLTNSEYETYGGTCKNKDPLKIAKTLKHNLTLCSLEDISMNQTSDSEEHENELIYENAEHMHNTTQTSDASTETSETNSSLNYSSGTSEVENEDEWETEDETEEDESSSYSSIEETHAIIYDYPVQVICLEKCNNTLDNLFENNQVNEEKGACILFQIVMILLCYQKVFHFTHNDLHTNNIMYNETEENHLYYKYKNQYYKVPTHGKLFKLIDFGRSIYKFEGTTFCSDSFAASGDASSQYNCEPYMNEDKPRIDPNMSFDLCRLGCSIYDFIIHDDDEKNYNQLQKTIQRWCTDDNGKNVLYKKNGDDRYPNFKLYKMIARSVHTHTPEEQLKQDYFKQFACEKPSESCEIIDIDGMVYHG
jgi:hypothetical protein|uniref:Protein kinase domain-containing protein n=1 Tax=viral metagenome TaxID=1070528 RepID=A0A6C0ISQ8_9ZZZZ